MTDVRGHCDSRFSAVRDVFARSFAEGRELGASVSIVVDGERVVDLFGGHTDKTRTREWAADTLVNVYSTTKGWTAMCAHRLVDDGKLDLDAPVATYWPDFAQSGKADIRVKDLLTHRAGLPAVRATLPPEALYDWPQMTSALAAEKPWWEPGTKHGYHAVTFGWLVGEVIRRVSGMTTGMYFKTHFAGPLGLDAHIGLAESEDARCAELRPAPRDAASGATLLERIMAEPDSMTAKAFTNPITMVLPGTVSSRAWRGAELPSANGHATANAIARLYGSLARGGEQDGVRTLSKESIERCHEPHSFGMDAILGVTTRFGLGFMLTQPDNKLGPNPHAFGHTGAGGSLGFADPDAKLGFGFVTNRMGTSILVDPRNKALIEAAYASL